MDNPSARAPRRSASGPVPFLAALAAAALLSLLGAGLPFLLLELFAPEGSFFTNGDELLGLCAFALLVTLAVWIAAFFGYRRRRGLRFGVGSLIGAWLIVLVVDALWFYAGPPAAAAKADNAAFAAIQQHYIAARSADDREYLRQLTSLGLPGILTAQGLAHGDLAVTASRLSAVQSVVARARALSETRAAALRAEVAGSSVSPIYKMRALETIDRHVTNRRAARQIYWDREAARYNLLAQNVALLRANRASWIAVGDKIAWSRPDLMAKSSAIVTAVLAIEAAESAAVRQSSPRS